LSAHKPSTRIQHFGGAFFLTAVMAPLLLSPSDETLDSLSEPSPPEEPLLLLLLLEGSTYYDEECI